MRHLFFSLIFLLSFSFAYANPVDRLLERIDKGASAKFKTELVKSDKDFLNSIPKTER